MNYQILLVEDDPQMREIITDYFTAQTEDEIDIICASDGNEGLERVIEAQFDLALLDIMLPGISGFELCRELRKNNAVPIIFLTARGGEEDKLYGYLSGCDDYIVKPFSLAVLYAKVKALVKREKGMVLTPILVLGDIELNPTAYTVTVRKQQIDMAPKEYALLKYLMEHKNQVVTREELLIRIWGYEFEGTDRVVDNHIKNLRKLLSAGCVQIKTVRNAGYKMEEKCEKKF